MAPEQDVQDMEMDSSPVSEITDVAAPVADSADALSSSAPGVTDDSSLSIVRDVVDATKQPAEASPAEGQEAGKDPAATDPKKEPDNENYSDVPFAKHPRFRQLIKEKNELKVDADRYKNVQTFLDQHNVSAEQAANVLLIQGLANTDPVKAWEMAKPLVKQLLIAAGEILPEDLQQRVEKGELPETAAFELSRTKAQAEAARTQMSLREQQQERSQRMSLEQSLFNTAQAWAQDRMAKDPNFTAKMPAIMKELKAIQFDEGKPDTPEGVKAQLKRAYEAVQLPAQVKPVVRQGTPVRSSMTGQVSGNTRPAPESTLDIIRAHRAAH